MLPAKLESDLWVTPSLRLTKCIDEGAMGSVWLADHTRLDTEVVVKFVRENLAADATVRRRLEIEARAAARIRSPHVVRVFDFGVYEETTPYIVMEHLVGHALRHQLDLDDTLSLRDTMLVVNHTCRALQEAHRLGIVHRDIKPANLFLLEDEVQGLFVKVLDFGVAKGLAQNVTEPGSLVGTPAYLSPEQLKSQAATHLSDLWALAAVTYECVVGEGPFHGETVDEVFARIWRCHADPPSLFNPQISPELDAWFARALGPQTELRPQSASELASSFFDAALTCEEMLNAPDEEWSSTRWRLELDAPRSTLPHGTPISGARPRRVSSVELTAASAPRRTLSGDEDPQSTSEWSERPPESRPPASEVSTLPAPDSLDPPTLEDDAASSAAAEDPGRDRPTEASELAGESDDARASSMVNGGEDELPTAALVPMAPRSHGRVFAAGLALAVVVGMGLWFTSNGAAPADRAPAPAVLTGPDSRRPVAAPPRDDDAAAKPKALAPDVLPATPEAPPTTRPPPSAEEEKPAEARVTTESSRSPKPTATEPAATGAAPGPAPQPPPRRTPAPTKHGKELGF